MTAGQMPSSRSIATEPRSPVASSSGWLLTSASSMSATCTSGTEAVLPRPTPMSLPIWRRRRVGPRTTVGLVSSSGLGRQEDLPFGRQQFFRPQFRHRDELAPTKAERDRPPRTPDFVQLAGLRELAGLRVDWTAREDLAIARIAVLRGHETGEWSRHSDLNRGPAVYEVDRPERCGRSVKSRA